MQTDDCEACQIGAVNAAGTAYALFLFAADFLDIHNIHLVLQSEHKAKGTLTN